MDGTYVYPLFLVGAVVASALGVSRRYDIPLREQAEIAFLLGTNLLWIVAAVTQFGQSPLRLYPEGRPKPAVAIAPSDGERAAALSSPATIGATPGGKAFGVGGVTPHSPLGLDGMTAVYDISAHTVYLPDGTKLEAHSGLGSRLDDPRHVSERMRGATPPNLYDLALREKPFHGVRALRLKPIGDGNIFGRSGLLAHTYMLGPNGESNGCVVFRNYTAFLEAFLNGAVKHLFVVPRLAGL